MTSERIKSLLELATPEELMHVLRAANRQLEPKAAAAYLNVSVRCLEEWRKRATGPKWRKIGKRVFYCTRDLDEFGQHPTTEAKGQL